MDRSDHSVRMSEKSEEIQKSWSPKEGDLFADELCHISIVNPAIVKAIQKPSPTRSLFFQSELRI
jgi:hypothetical protein